MSSKEQKESQTLPVDTFTKRGLALPCGVPFNADEYMRFDGAYRQFLLATDKLEVTFFNGKSLKVSYNFDATRMEEDRLLINWDTLTPLFGGVTPPGDRNFVRLPEILKFVQERIHLNKCKTGGADDSCFCGRDKPVEVDARWGACADQHFHHFCSSHVRSWLLLYLYPTILFGESKVLFREVIDKVHRRNPNVLHYYAALDASDTEVLFEAALDIGDSGFIEEQSQQ